MSDKILFWLDQHLKQFCLSYYLQKEIDATCFAIIDITNNPRKFFENQKFVNFEKTWFYHDYVFPDKKQDIEYLKLIEKKYGINLWKYAINERIFYRFNDFYKFSESEMLSILEKECRFFEKVLDEIRPDYVVMHETFFQSDEIFYKICKARNIKILMSYVSTFGYKHELSQNSHVTDEIEKFQKIKSEGRNFEQLGKKFNRSRVEKYVQTLNDKQFGTNNDLVKAGFDFLLKSKNKNPETHYTYFGRTKLKVILNTISNSFKTKDRKKFIDSNLKRKVDFDKNYIYFPLHIDQERTSLIESPFYTDQIEFITNIVKSIPPGYTLYLKEHPSQETRHWREQKWYRTVMDIPNVVLFHPDVSSKKLIQNSSLVITISGTAALEAVFYQKPSITFIDADYTILSSIERVKSIEDLPTIIRKSLEKEVNVDELDRYVTLMDNVTFDFDEAGFNERCVDTFFYGGRLADTDISSKTMEKFLINEKKYFEEITTQHVKKINYWKTSKINS